MTIDQTTLEQIIQRVIGITGYNEYLSPEKMAQRLSVHPNTIRDWCHNYDKGVHPQLPYTKFGPKCLRVKTKDFVKFCESREC